MATYIGKHGSKVKTYTTDPDNPNLGQVWYNATANTIKIEAVTTSGSWATGGSLNVARSFMAGTGISSSAGLAFGGTSGPMSALNESYNGTSFTEVNDLNTARAALGGAGTQTSTLAFGGNQQNPTTFAIAEIWNGTNWTETTDMNAVHSEVGSAGVDSTSALCFGGNQPPPQSADTELWNGSNWTEVNNLNNPRNQISGSGNVTAALAYAGGPGNSTTDFTEIWNGTNWTEVNNLNFARTGATDAGTNSTLALCVGGSRNPASGTKLNNVEEWNGTNWTAVQVLPATKATGAGNGTTVSAFAAGGFQTEPTRTTSNYEWTGAGSPQVRTIDTD